jgi:AcrR family transcriptional regulator
MRDLSRRKSEISYGRAVVTQQRLLRAAADVLAEQGMAASMHAIARRAGVTKMTLYRHFESKEDLLLAVMADHFDRLRAVAEELDGSAESGIVALEAYLERALRQIGPDRRYFHVALMAGGANDVIKASAFALDAAVSRLLERARSEHSVREDVVAGDIHSLMIGMSSTVDWGRSISMTMDGLRACDDPLEEPPMELEDYARFQAERALRRGPLGP